MAIQAAALYATVGVSGAGSSVRQLGAVSGAVDATQKKFELLGLKAQGYSKGVRQMAGGLVKVGEVVAAGFVVATVASAKFASDFQSHMELIHTQAGATQTEVDKMTGAVQDLVHSVGTSPDELAKGLYHIESVGVRGAAALDILKASAIGAKVGLADMDSVTNALTAVWFSGIQGAKSMTDAMAILDGVVGVGNMHLQDLTDSFKSGILGTAATFGVDIRSLGAAIATLTDAGVPANIAATRLNMTLSHMAAPVPKAIDTLKKLGIGQYDLANDLRKPDGIFVALKDLHDHLEKVGQLKDGKLTPKGADSLTKIFGGSRFGATAMQLLTQMDRVDQKYALITERSNTFAGNVKDTMATASFHWGQFIADLENDAISFGQGVLPGLISGLDKLDSFVVAHRADALTMGRDVGKAITDIGNALDHVDWTRFQSGFEMVKSVAQVAIDALKLVPPEVAVAFAGLVGIDKLSGGLLGKGTGNIIGTALGQFFGRGSLANPMWVRQVGGIPGLPGGGGAAEAAAEAVGGSIAGDIAAGFATIGIGGVAGLVIAPVSIAAIALAITGASDPEGKRQFAGRQGTAAARGLDPNGISHDRGAGAPGSINVYDNWRAQNRASGDLSEAASQLRNAARFDGAKADLSEAATQLRNAARGLNYSIDHRTNAEIFGASAKARGFTYKPGGKASDSLEARFSFLKRDNGGSKDSAVADSLRRLFETSSNPLYTSDRNLKAAIHALEADVRTVGPKTASHLRGDIAALKAELARRTTAAAEKTARAAMLAGLDTSQAIRDKNLSAHVTVTPARTTIKVNGKNVASATVYWAPSDGGYVRNL